MNSTTVSLTRREIAAFLLAAAGSGVVPYWAGAQDDASLLQITLPPAERSTAPSFEIFLALSRIVLIQDDLDETAARQMYDLFMAEPWGPKHIGTAYAALRETFIKRGQRGGQEMIAQTPLPDGERWFISHLVTTWYVGVYYHPERPTKWITLHGAMIYRAVHGLVPKSYLESVGYGRWANPPDTETSK
jgi:Membrane bound FAD containing D-sorbitol dehydrogenase